LSRARAASKIARMWGRVKQVSRKMKIVPS
jgi:hypothetical protein